MKWRVEGADERTGADRTVIVVAANEVEAINQARAMGLFVSKVTQVPADPEAYPDRSIFDMLLRAKAPEPGTPQAGTGLKANPDERWIAKNEKRRAQVELGRHVQWVRLTGSSELALVVCVALGVFIGLTVFSCLGLLLGLAGLSGAVGTITPGV